MTPSNSDLGQLLESLKLIHISNKLNIATNQGTASQWSGAIPALPISPAPAGTAVWFKPGLASVLGGTTFTLNGEAALPVQFGNGMAISVGDVTAGAWLLLYNDGAHWQVMCGATRVGSSLPMLQGPMDWYVNQGTGNDSLYDGTAAVVIAGTNHGPFQNLQRAANEVIKYNMNGFNQTVHVADGSYTNSLWYQLNGTGACFITGNPVNPQNVNVSTNISQQAAMYFMGGPYWVQGLRLSCSGAALDGITVDQKNGVVRIYGNMRFGPCVRAHMSSYAGCSLTIGAPNYSDTPPVITIETGANSATHMLAATNALVGTIGPPFVVNWPSLIVQGAVTMSQSFVHTELSGTLQAFYQSITGAANVTGQKYNAIMNGTIDSLGGGVNYYPGSSAGTLATGGQYM